MALRHIDPDRIRANPDNPRLVFREAEMNQLLESIRQVGIRVPLSVYEDGDGYVLIDGERRWRCARRLNLEKIPAITQPKPTRLENILMMFNIHNVRLDWDLMPMAVKLREVRDLLAEEGRPAGVRDLAAVTGVSTATVRRAIELLELPTHYQKMLLSEAEKPKEQQRIKADLFVEINKSRNAIRRYVPEVFGEVSEEEYVEAMVDKYLDGVVDNVVSFRDVSRTARAERAGESREEAIRGIVRLARRHETTIEQIYENTVAAAYEVRDLETRSGALVEKLRELTVDDLTSRSLREHLFELRAEIDRLLGA